MDIDPASCRHIDETLVAYLEQRVSRRLRDVNENRPLRLAESTIHELLAVVETLTRRETARHAAGGLPDGRFSTRRRTPKPI